MANGEHKRVLREGEEHKAQTDIYNYLKKIQ